MVSKRRHRKEVWTLVIMLYFWSGWWSLKYLLCSYLLDCIFCTLGNVYFTLKTGIREISIWSIFIIKILVILRPVVVRLLRETKVLIWHLPTLTTQWTRHRKTVLTGYSRPLYTERQPKCNQQIVTKSLLLTKNMSKITHQSLDSGHENLRPWTNTTFQLHTFLLRLKKMKSLWQLKAHTKSSSSSPLSEASHKNRLLGFAKNHGFSRFQVGRVAIVRALSQNIDPNNGDVKNGLPKWRQNSQGTLNLGSREKRFANFLKLYPRFSMYLYFLRWESTPWQFQPKW